MSSSNKVGETGFSARDHEYADLCGIPAEAALSWALAVAPKTFIGGTTIAEIHQRIHQDPGSSVWPDDTFVLVAEDRNRGVLGISFHDGRWFLIHEGSERYVSPRQQGRVGGAGTYPEDQGFRTHCEIPIAAALAWALAVAPDAYVGDGTVKEVAENPARNVQPNGWRNRQYVIVEDDEKEGCLAVYVKDGIWHLTRARAPK